MGSFQMVKVDDRIYPGTEIKQVYTHPDNPKLYVITLHDGRIIETTHSVTVVRMPNVTPFMSSTRRLST
jgi:hypothetical protein